MTKFGPLRAEPSLTLTVPHVANDPRNGSGADGLGDAASVQSVAVDGGIAFVLNPHSGSASKSSMLAVVDHGGKVRWALCLDQRIEGVWVAPGASRMLLVQSSFTDRPQYRGSWIDPIDGHSIGSLVAPAGVDAAALADLAPVATSKTAVLLARGSWTASAPDVLVHADLVSGTTTSIAPQGGIMAGWRGGPPTPDCGNDVYALSAKGEPMVLAGFTNGGGAIKSVWADGTWRAPTAAERETAGVQVARECGSAGQLRAYNPDGTIAWTATFTVPALEGPIVAVGDDVVISAGCARSSATQCAAPFTVALDRKSGAELWRSARMMFVPAGAANGVAIVSRWSLLAATSGGDDGWEMIDVRTGVPLLGQRWNDRGAFLTECCGGAEFTHVDRLGGIVVATERFNVRVWYPASVTVPAVTIPLPIR